MNELQVFNYGTNNVRTVHVDNEPWFVLTDVCSVLGLGTPSRVAERLDEDDVSLTHITDSLGRKQSTTIINESGLYTVILKCKKPEAKPFRKWVTSEVLPSIRKHGAYMTAPTIENIISNPEFGIQLLTTLKSEQDKRKALELENAQQKHLLLEAQPKLEYVDKILSTTNAINITQIAKDYGMGGAKMNKILCDLGIQYKMNGQWLLHSKYANKGYTKSKTNYYEDDHGEKCSRLHTRWTQKGRLFLYKKLKANNILPLEEQED